MAENANITRARALYVNHLLSALAKEYERLDHPRITARDDCRAVGVFSLSHHRPWFAAIQTNGTLADGRPMFDPLGDNYHLEGLSAQSVQRAWRCMSPLLEAEEDQPFVIMGKHMEKDPAVTEVLEEVQEVASVVFVDHLRNRGWTLFAATTDDPRGACHQLLALMNSNNPSAIRRRLSRGNC